MIKVSIFAAALLVSGAASAAQGDNTNNGSTCGQDHAARADVNGNFGDIGKVYQGAPNYHGGVQGQEPGATGYNNSHTNCQNTPS